MVNYKQVADEGLTYVAVAATGELGNGQRKILEIDGLPVALFNIAGEYFAIADICSHDDGPVAEGELKDHTIECPRHGAHFDIRNGKVLSLPAIVDIPAYPVRIEGDEILIGLPLEEV